MEALNWSSRVKAPVIFHIMKIMDMQYLYLYDEQTSGGSIYKISSIENFYRIKIVPKL